MLRSSYILDYFSNSGFIWDKPAETFKAQDTHAFFPITGAFSGEAIDGPP